MLAHEHQTLAFREQFMSLPWPASVSTPLKQLDASLVSRVSWVIEEDIVKGKDTDLFLSRFNAAQSVQPCAGAKLRAEGVPTPQHTRHGIARQAKCGSHLSCAG